MTRFDYRWGFQGDALMTVTRLKAPRPRRGPLALFDQPSFDKGKLPPLPEGIESFTVVSVDADKSYENLLAAASTPEATRPDQLVRRDAQGQDAGRPPQGPARPPRQPKFAFYAMPGGAAVDLDGPRRRPASPPPATRSRGCSGTGTIPRFTLSAEVDDNAAFIRTLDNLMTGFNKVAREQAAAAEAAAAPPEAPRQRSPRPAPAPPPAPEFKLTPSSNPAERSYVLNIPPALARQFPAGYRPTIRLLKKQLVISTTPESARLAIEVKAGEWVPPADLAPAFDPLPKELIVLGARDPRSTLPENLASLPATIQRAVNTVLAGAGAAAAGPPGAGAGAAPPPMLVFNIPVTRLPKPDELRERLFPGSFAVAADDQEMRIITRLSFPAVLSPSSVSMWRWPCPLSGPRLRPRLSSPRPRPPPPERRPRRPHRARPSRPRSPARRPSPVRRPSLAGPRPSPRTDRPAFPAERAVDGLNPKGGKPSRVST